MSCLIIENVFPHGTGVQLSASGLCKRYAGVDAVVDVSFDVHTGEALGLLGPNGAGKSTTMLLLGGVLRPDAGRVMIAGEHDPTRANVRRWVGYAPQSLALYPELTARENLTLLGRLYGLSRALLGERVEEALELAQLSDRANDRVRAYSGGMQRRLNLAAATVHAPKVLLLDEPTVGVDPQSRAHIYCCIEELKRRGMCIVYSTHHLEEAERLCDRVAIMDRGSILVAGSVSDLVREHGGGSRVEARLPKPPEAVNLAKYWEAGHFRCTTDDPKGVINGLMSDTGELMELSVRRPGLEAVFMNLTGRRMRDV